MSGDKFSATAAIATCRARLTGPEYTAANLTLDRLETDRRMRDGWPLIVKHLNDQLGLSDIIYEIVIAKRKADLYASSASWPADWGSEYAKLSDAINTLASFFRHITFSQQNAQFEQFKTGLAWAKQTIDFQHESKTEALPAEMPQSRKHQPMPAFYKLLCGVIEVRLGQPLYGFVAIIAAVCFGITTEIDPKTVQAAYREERRNRAAA